MLSDLSAASSALNWLEPLSLAIIAYPFVTSLLWSFTSLHYLARRALRATMPTDVSSALSYSVVIPFHAEPNGALTTARSLVSVSPAPNEIVLIDDGSPVGLDSRIDLPAGVRVVRLARNVGKAGALQSVLRSLRSDVVVCLDADTISETQDWLVMLAQFNDPSLGAVTGKIRPMRTKGLIEWLQALDYLTVIAVIKAAETSWGGLMTVSGAFTAFRASALRDVGGWSASSATEDIDLSWRLQAAGWRIAFESDWIARVEMAPTLKALWRQRRRWSAGLGRALRDHGAICLARARHAPIIVITLTSILWMTSIIALIVLHLTSAARGEAPAAFDGQFLITIAVAGLAVFYAQLAAAIWVDGRGVLSNWRCIVIAPLYPLYFWGVLSTSFLSGFPKGLLRRDNGRWLRTQRVGEISGVQ